VPVTLRRGRVTGIVERHEGLVRLEVEGRPCVAYPALTGAVALGDDVLVNVQAVELGLGTGGYDVLHANLTRGLDLVAEEGAHVMKLPYTSLQHAVRHVEEPGDQEPKGDLGGLPVVCCSLHSQVAPACAGLGLGLRVAYVQLGGGALPVPLSDTVRALRAGGYLRTTGAVAGDPPPFGQGGPLPGRRFARTDGQTAPLARDRLRNRAIGPGLDFPAGQFCLHSRQRQRPVLVMAEILLARPHASAAFAAPDPLQ